MTEPFIGQIMIVGFNFAPRGWAQCNGANLSIAQNTALFALLGTMYGGNGQTTFGLPNLQDQAPINFGQGPGLSNRVIGETAGSASVTLNVTQMPVHTHTPLVGSGQFTSPTNNTWGTLSGRTPPPIYTSNTPNVSMNALALQPAGGSLPHNNMQPYLGLNFVIALQGIWPSRQ
jgi:microcystin-dependent protein